MSCKAAYDTRYVYGADALGAEGTLDNNFRLRKRRACATYGNRAAKWTATKSSETLYFNTMWTWHTDKGLPEGQYSKHIYLGETRVVTKQTSKLEASYGQSDERRHRYYYHPDHLGSAQLITDYEGNEYQRIEYTPYGELWVEKKTEHEEGLRYLPYKFTAKEQDEETGLYYYGARYLDAKYSRWMSADPAVGEYIPQTDADISKLPAGGVYDFINLSLYHYAGNNPIKYTDPDGNFKRKEFIFAAIQTVGGIGEVAGGVLTTGLSAWVSIYAVMNGLCNIGEGIMGMVAAANDKEYVGVIPTMTSKLAEKYGASEQIQELVAAYAALADTIIDGIVTKGMSVVGDGKQTVSAGVKIVNSLNTINSNVSEGNVYIEAAKKTVEFDQQYNKNNNSGNQNE
ncbi:RHS repeat domain-containing protein [Treponema socranskii]|uniref:RHS repeat domain-containing protein n=1 Tax=Treponema socranskii TaxID=53419 RepID=UPI003D89B8B5